MRYPLEFEELHKGDSLERDRLFEILGPMPEGKFRLAVLTLGRQIEQECHCTCKTEHSGKSGLLLRLRLLTDSEAARYNPKLCDQHINGFRRRLRLASRVDFGKLNQQERADLEAQLVLKSRQYQAFRSAGRREITVPLIGRT